MVPDVVDKLQNFVHKKKLTHNTRLAAEVVAGASISFFRLLVVSECSNEKGSSLELLKGDQSPNGGSVMNFPPGKDS